MLGLRMTASPGVAKGKVDGRVLGAASSPTRHVRGRVHVASRKLPGLRLCDSTTFLFTRTKVLRNRRQQLSIACSASDRPPCPANVAWFGARRRCQPRPDRPVSPTVALSPKHLTACSSGTTFATTSRPATPLDFSLLAVFCLVAFTPELSPVAICQPTHRCSRLRAFASRSLPTSAPLLRLHIL